MFVAGLPAGPVSTASPAGGQLLAAFGEFDGIQTLGARSPKRPFLSRALEGLSRRQGGRSSARPAVHGLHELIALQRADGSWELTHELCTIVGHDLNALEQALSGGTGQRDDLRRAWATALALVWLTEHAAENEDEWRMLAAKARRFLDGVAAVPASRGPWIDEARRFERQGMR